MTKKEPGAKRGAKPHNDEKHLDAMAEELIHLHDAFLDDGRDPDKYFYDYNYNRAYTAMRKKQGDPHANHEEADRKRLYRKLKAEIENPVEAHGSDGWMPIVPRLEKAECRVYERPYTLKTWEDYGD